MRTRKLGFTDLQLTRMGFGAWALGGGGEWGWGSQDDQESISAIQRGIDLGINWIDTAASYGHGRSEEVVGQAIKGRRDKVILATKCGIVWDENKNNFFRMKSWSVRQEAENSLRRLGVDMIDLYQIHVNSPDEDLDEAWAEVACLIQEGKVRYGGVSNWTVDQIKRAQLIHPVASLQPKYNMLDREVEDKLLDFCAANQIGVVAYSPMASGLLTGKVTKEWVKALPTDDWRSHNNSHFLEPELSINLELIEKLRPIAHRNNCSIGELAIAWTLRRPELTAAIVGARKPSQIEQTVNGANLDLDQNSQNDIEALLKEARMKLAGK
jgi:aryl-alcohol dehydrogenase-like predicted oxidoreductase